MPLPALLFALFGALLLGLVGGYGGARLAARQLSRELAEVGADLVGFDIRLKKLEGRATRAARPPSEDPDIAQAVRLAQQLSGGARRPGFAPAQAETEAEILGRVFPAKKSE